MRILNTTYEAVPPTDPMTAEEILDLCCTEVPFDPCAKVGRVSVYQGADQEDWDFDPDEELAKAQANEAWKNSGRRIVSVSTEGVGNRSGKPCGKKYEEWTGHNNCCDFVEPMEWDTETSVEVLAPNSRGVVGVTGGAPPYHWSVRGQGFALNQQGNLRDGFTDTPYVWIYALHNACGFAPIEVFDGCSVVNDGVRATVGSWVQIGWPNTTYDCLVHGDNSDFTTFGDGWNWVVLSGKYKMLQQSYMSYWGTAPFQMCGSEPLYTFDPTNAQHYSCISGFEFMAAANAVRETDRCFWEDLGYYGIRTWFVSHNKTTYEWRC